MGRIETQTPRATCPPLVDARGVLIFEKVSGDIRKVLFALSRGQYYHIKFAVNQKLSPI